jgi:hypothetical protein
MNNTQQTVNEAIALAKQLVEKTEEKKLTWTVGDIPSRFAVNIGNGFEFTIYTLAPDWLGILVQDNGGLELLRAEVESNPQYGYSSPIEAQLSKVLENLYDLARRSALDVDRKVLAVKGLLESL